MKGMSEFGRGNANGQDGLREGLSGQCLAGKDANF